MGNLKCGSKGRKKCKNQGLSSNISNQSAPPRLSWDPQKKNINMIICKIISHMTNLILGSQGIKALTHTPLLLPTMFAGESLNLSWSIAMICKFPYSCRLPSFASYISYILYIYILCMYMIVKWNPTQQLFNTAQHKITKAPLLCCRATVAASRAAWPSRFHRVNRSNKTAIYWIYDK